MAIKKYQEGFGVVPTYETLAEIVGVRSLSTVDDLLNSLQSKGWLVKGRRGEKQSMILLGN